MRAGRPRPSRARIAAFSDRACASARSAVLIVFIVRVLLDVLRLLRSHQELTLTTSPDPVGAIVLVTPALALLGTATRGANLAMNSLGPPIRGVIIEPPPFFFPGPLP